MKVFVGLLLLTFVLGVVRQRRTRAATLLLLSVVGALALYSRRFS